MQRIDALNGLRGIAAAIVAVDHFTLLSGYAPAGTWPYYVATFGGSFGIGLFFLISGFVIPLSLFKSGTAEFALRRVLRLLPVFAVCCALRWIELVQAGGSQFDMHTLGIFLLNISMFGTLELPLEKLIEPIVWTLAIEVKFYIVTAILFHFFRHDARKLFQACLVLLSVIAVAAHNFSFQGAPWKLDVALGLSVVPFMFNGLFVSMLFYGKISRADAFVGIVVATAAFLMAPCPWFVSPLKEIPSWIVAAGVFGLALAKRDHVALLTGRAAQWFGDISYPLYAVHVGTASVCLAYVPSWPGKIAAFLIGAPLVAWAIHVAVERPFIQLSKQISRGIQRDPALAEIVTAPSTVR